MADWFKIYENDLDEMRLQWAIGELPEILSIWLVMLSEACRHKDGTLSGYSQDFELFGISKRINVSVPKVNQGIELLIKIKYLERTETGLLIRKWNEKQSEYCQKKTRLQNQSGDNHHTKRTKKADSVRIVSGHTPESVRQEERRGEENIYKKRLGNLFKRKEKTQWDVKEESSLKILLKRSEFPAELDEIEKYYTSGAEYLRHDVQTLLNNWNGELDRARKVRVNGSSVKKDVRPSLEEYQKGSL